MCGVLNNTMNEFSNLGVLWSGFASPKHKIRVHGKLGTFADTGGPDQGGRWTPRVSEPGVRAGSLRGGGSLMRGVLCLREVRRGHGCARF